MTIREEFLKLLGVLCPLGGQAVASIVTWKQSFTRASTSWGKSGLSVSFPSSDACGTGPGRGSGHVITPPVWTGVGWLITSSSNVFIDSVSLWG
ncbi:hypothetical protein HF325_005883 [Metschnikowia pulcherrima]|uniref:Uncharacterized protein n=1 Tax=Metschnikowia pulcherrima TaxID=27326 RepID=A0A8H7GPC2_9ASCO|nr:hypothetical protein HF325_005883 [Metschnikowia pulcherrima]